MNFTIVSKPQGGENVNKPSAAVKRSESTQKEVDALMQQKARIASEYYQWQNRLQDDGGDPVKIQENCFVLDQIESRWNQMKELNQRASKLSQNIVDIPPKPEARGPVVVYSTLGNFTEEELEAMDIANLALLLDRLDHQRIKAQRYIPRAKNPTTKAANEKKVIQKIAEKAIVTRIITYKRNAQRAT